ncbi:serine hydrolase [Microbacterium oleivorans]|uniref:Serine hydrolase n=1 Tax=Microbacterium oleivorans TaxID=273677 RepID=A0A7D5EXB8_9MICO|nr:Cpe/LpqF family protein [Microbacterium oleivorans]QLD11108.1 serine hydrolase [Microbacterium oleivorans]
MTASSDTPPARPSETSRARRSAALALAAITTVALAACSPADPGTGSAASGSASAAEIPDTAVGAHAQWVLDEINADEPTAIEEIETRFAPASVAELTAAGLQDVFTQMQAAAPWTPIAYEGADTQARVTIESEQVTYDMSISVTPDDQIGMLLFAPPEPERTPAASWDELREQVEAASFEVSVQVTEAGGDVLQSIGDPGAAPIGSIFKLWVLGAVVAAVADGTMTWEDELTIDAQVRSLPSGELQDLPDGATVTVREAAEKMIAISDNTGTDALIRAVGRESVEAAMAAMGHAEPERNTPFPTTRELFWLLFGDDDLRALWGGAAGDVDARRALLERIPAGVPDLTSAATTQPGWRDGADWFATSDDLVAAQEALQEYAGTEAGAPVRDILAANPGLEFGDEWSYVGFKGGSSVGVLAGSWYLEREGAAPVVVTVLARSDDPQDLTSPGAVLGWAQDAAAILAAP